MAPPDIFKIALLPETGKFQADQSPSNRTAHRKTSRDPLEKIPECAPFCIIHD